MTTTAATTDSPHNEGLAILKRLQHANPSIGFVRCQWVDYTASVRTRLVTVRQAIRLATHRLPISVASPIVSGFLLNGSFNEINAGAKDSLIPGWSTLVSLRFLAQPVATSGNIRPIKPRVSPCGT